MFEEFENTKQQLAELAETINKFKSEAVQLRLLELLAEQPARPKTRQGRTAATPATKKQAKPASSQKPSPPSKGKAKRRATSGTGPAATLQKLYDGGYFSQPRQIGDICAHAETKLDRKIKANDISGKLARMVRGGELTRTKSSDGQFQYIRP